jgi:signal transduction histidine kinase
MKRTKIGKERGFRNQFLRVALLAVSVSAWISGEIFFAHLEKSGRQTTHFIFRLPFPDEVAEKFGFRGDEPGVEVARVSVAGYFSDWSAENPGFQLSPDSDGSWRLDADLDPGVHQYKFRVFFKKDATEYWTHDRNNPETVPDGFNGKNSILKIPDYHHYRLVFRLIAGGITLLVLSYFLLETFIRAVMGFHVSLRWKIVLCVIALSLVSNVWFIAYNLYRYREICRVSAASQLNFVHLFLMAENFDFSRIEKNSAAASAGIERYLVNAGPLGETRYFQNNQLLIRTVAVYSPDLRMITAVWSRHERNILDMAARSSHCISTEAYLRDVVFAPIIHDASLQPKPLREPIFGKMATSARGRLSPAERNNLLLTGFDTVLVPIRNGGKIAGYYAADVYPQIFESFFRSTLWFNLALVPLSTLFVFLLFSYLGGIVVSHLRQITDWSDRITKGNYSESEKISTRDEIARLADNLDILRVSLRESFEHIVDQNHRLQDLNLNLRSRVDEEVGKNREKDLLMIRQSRSAAMGEMLSNIAHQWRQPLTVLSLYLQSLQDRQKFGVLTPEKMDETCKNGLSVITHLSGTIDDFRNFFKPDREKSIFSIADTIERALFIVGPALQNAGVRIFNQCRNDAKIEGFPNEFGHVVLNLLNNIHDAVNERKISEPQIFICTEEADGCWRIIFRDNAGGIPEEHLDRVFDPYFTTKDHGTGIGLYMSRMIVERNMGGQINVINLDGGAEFAITLPMA